MAIYILTRKTYATPAQNQQEGKKKSSLGKKLAIGAAVAGGTLLAAKKGAFGAKAQMGINNRLGQLGGKISQYGSKHNSGLLSKVGDKTMMSAANDFKAGAVKSNTNSLNRAVSKWNGREGVKKIATGDALTSRINNKANLRAENLTSAKMDSWLGGK